MNLNNKDNIKALALEMKENLKKRKAQIKARKEKPKEE